MATLSSPGLGSGLDVAGIVNKLVAAEGAPATARLDKLEAGFQARISGLGSLKGALSAFQSTLNSLNSADSFSKSAVSNSNTAALTATASSSTSSGSYTVNVSKLAQSQTIVSSESQLFTSVSDVVGTGTLTFKYGTGPIGTFSQNVDKGTYTITIDSSNNTLEGIRDEINSADIGVKASIIYNGTGYLLSLTSSDTGAANSMEITVSDTGDGNNSDTSGLSRLAYNSSATNMTEKLTAQNAELTINGVSITSDTNTVKDSIEGLQLQLLDTQSTILNVTQDKDGVTTSITNFIDSYNKLAGVISDLTKYDPQTGAAGILNGDFGTRTIISQIRKYMSQNIDQLTGTTFSNLPSLGVTMQADGTLFVDTTKLRSAMDANFSAVAKIFSAVGTPSDQLINYLSSSSDSLPGTYDVNIDVLASQGMITGSTTSSLADNGSGVFTSPFIIDSNNDTFSVNVDGISSGSINLTQNTYNTAAELAAEIQSRINADSNLKENGVAVAVSFDSTTDSFSITSVRYGSASTVSFSSVDINTSSSLGFDTTLTGTDGVDVQGSIGGVMATGNGQILTANGDATGLKIEVSGGSTGNRGTLVFSRGIADQLSQYINKYMDNDIIGDRISGIQTSIDDISRQRDELDRRLASLESRLQARFTALDVLVNKLQSSGNFLSQQLTKLNSTLSAKN